VKNVAKKFQFMKIGQPLPGFVRSAKRREHPNGMRNHARVVGKP
jgi:hypothetical protein